MEAMFKVIGVFVIGIILISFPILLTCSFFLNWNGFISLLLIIGTFLDWAFICSSLSGME